MAVLAVPGSSWSPAVPCRGARAVVRPAMATNSRLFGQVQQQRQRRHRRRAWGPLFSAENEESEEVEATSTEVAKDSTEGDDEEEKFGVLRTILLAGPLFIKFTIVLL